MLFQCSARLTLIWLSGSALPRCQAVWRGLETRGSVFVPSRDRLQGCKTSVCSQTLTHTSSPSPSLYFTTAGFSFPASAPSVPALFLLPLSFHSLSRSLAFSVSHMQGHTHTCTHFLLFLSKASLKELWLCGLEEIQTCCRFVGFSPKLVKHNTAMLTGAGWVFKGRLIITWTFMKGGCKQTVICFVINNFVWCQVF